MYYASVYPPPSPMFRPPHPPFPLFLLFLFSIRAYSRCTINNSTSTSLSLFLSLALSLVSLFQFLCCWRSFFLFFFVLMWGSWNGSDYRTLTHLSQAQKNQCRIFAKRKNLPNRRRSHSWIKQIKNYHTDEDWVCIYNSTCLRFKLVKRPEVTL